MKKELTKQQRKAKAACEQAGVEFLDLVHMMWGTLYVEFRTARQQHSAYYNYDQSIAAITKAIEDVKTLMEEE